MIYEIDVKDCKELWHPHNKYLKRNYICRIPAINLVGKFNKWREVNPRYADIAKNRRVIDGIEDTAINHPDRFCSCNCGFLMFAKDLVSTSKNTIIINLDNTKIHGLVDGGHTYETLTATAKNGLLSEEVVITVEFLVGYTEQELDEILAIAQGRNTNTSLANYSLQNSRGCFDIIKQTLKEYPYANKIAYKENDKELDADGELLYVKNFDVRLLLSRLGVLVAEWCPRNAKSGKVTHPYQFYSSKGTATNYMGDKNKYDLIVNKYIHLLPDALKLYDYIYCNIPKWYNAGGGKFGKTHIFASSGKLIENTSKIQLLTGLVPEYKNIMNVIPLIILSSLRAILKEDKNCKYNWVYEPKQFLDKFGTKLVVCLYDSTVESKQNAKSYRNRNNTIWENVYSLAENCYFKEILEKIV